MNLSPQHWARNFHTARQRRWLLGLLGSLLFSAASAADFARGADVSWLTQMEASGRLFFNSSGEQQDCLQVLKETGIDSIRLRVWVNPAGGWNGLTDVVNKAVRAKNLGLRVMIDFHYSDSWADPGQQTKPSAWSAHGIVQLNTDVAEHTAGILNALKAAGVTPEWVQVGNETNDGMLWNEGRASSGMANFAGLVTSGYDAVKAVFPDAKVIVHISNGYNNTLFRWMFDGLTANGAKFDVIGMSLYPTSGNWPALTSQCLANVNDMVARYGKEVMICEVGMDVNAAVACKAFLTELIAQTQAVAGGKGLGVFYWEPESYNWQGYSLGAFGGNGRPTVALEAFNFAPVITAQPANQTVIAGGSVMFTVAAGGAPRPSFQWRKDGVAIPGATGSTYTIASASLADAGSYTVVAANTGGLVTSNAAVLTLIIAPSGAVITIDVE